MKLGAMNNPHRELIAEIQWIGQNGLDFIDLAIEAPNAALESTDWKEIRCVIDDLGIDVICQAASYLPIDNPSPRVRQAALDEIRRSIDAAQILGAALCTTQFKGWPSYMSEKIGYEYYKQLYTILLKHGEDRGIEVALENSPENQHQLKYFRQIFHRLPHLKLLYNIGNGNVRTAAKSQTRDYLFALAEHLAHIHLSDNDGRNDDCLPLGAPGSGGIHLSNELRTLRSFGYEGTITLQITGERRLLLASAEWVRELWPQVT